MISIIDYDLGNVESIKKTLNFLNINSIITRDYNIIKKSESIILPGVGSFEQGMLNLKRYFLDEILFEQVIVSKKKFLGICLGMQLIMEYGSEPNLCKGLSWIEGNVTKINTSQLPIPHLGWNNIILKENNLGLFSGINSLDYYFVHSYKVEPKDLNLVLATTEYGEIFTSILQKDNILATQFHPEKSQLSGLKLLHNYFI